MGFLPFVSLAIAVCFAILAWKRRGEFKTRPYFHWFVYFNLSAVGLHQFEEYGWPGGFRDVFAGVFGTEEAASRVPSATSLELLNVFGFTTLFGLVGWLGTRVKWVGLGLLFTNFGNGFFHLVYSVVRLTYVPGAFTGALLYLPLGLLATRHAVKSDDIDSPRLLLAFGLGTGASFLPFIQVWFLHA